VREVAGARVILGSPGSRCPEFGTQPAEVTKNRTALGLRQRGESTVAADGLQKNDWRV
jgi:hypothetical protein